MGRRLIIVFLAALAVTWSGAGHASAGQPEEVKLRRWFVGLQGVGGDCDRWDVFGNPGQPSGEVEDSGGGGAFQFGYRFGGRFLLGLQLSNLNFQVVDSANKMRDVSVLFTGTVLFRERDTFQPFLRGGFGGGGVVEDTPVGYTVAFGTAVLAGGGFQVRLGSRVTLEADLGADFKNFHEVQDRPQEGPDSDWSVQSSNIGWHLGLGMAVWF